MWQRRGWAFAVAPRLEERRCVPEPRASGTAARLKRCRSPASLLRGEVSAKRGRESWRAAGGERGRALRGGQLRGGVSRCVAVWAERLRSAAGGEDGCGRACRPRAVVCAEER